MDSILSEIYSTVLGAAPFVIAAYALMWLVLLVYVAALAGSLRKTELRLAALEESLARRSEH